MTDLLKYGYVVRGYLGVETQDLTPELATEFKLHGSTGALVGGVAPNGPAEKAGLEVGDVITRFAGKDVRDARQLKLSVAEVKPGQTVPIEVLRDGSAKLLRVAIGQASNNDLFAKAARNAYEEDPGALRGVMIGELNGKLRQEARNPPRGAGCGGARSPGVFGGRASRSPARRRYSIRQSQGSQERRGRVAIDAKCQGQAHAVTGVEQ